MNLAGPFAGDRHYAVARGLYFHITATVRLSVYTALSPIGCVRGKSFVAHSCRGFAPMAAAPRAGMGRQADSAAVTSSRRLSLARDVLRGKAPYGRDAAAASRNMARRPGTVAP
jgi:hypothetical protein